MKGEFITNEAVLNSRWGGVEPRFFRKVIWMCASLVARLGGFVSRRFVRCNSLEEQALAVQFTFNRTNIADFWIVTKAQLL